MSNFFKTRMVSVGVASIAFAIAFGWNFISDLNIRGNARIIVPIESGQTGRIQFMLPRGKYAVACVLEGAEGPGAFGRGKRLDNVRLKISQKGKILVDGVIDPLFQFESKGYEFGVIDVEMVCKVSGKHEKLFVVFGKPL